MWNRISKMAQCEWHRKNTATMCWRDFKCLMPILYLLIHTMWVKHASASIGQPFTWWAWSASCARLSTGSCIMHVSYRLHPWRLHICCQSVCALHVQPRPNSCSSRLSGVALPCGHQVSGHHLWEICGDRSQSAVGHCRCGSCWCRWLLQCQQISVCVGVCVCVFSLAHF